MHTEQVQRHWARTCISEFAAAMIKYHDEKQRKDALRAYCSKELDIHNGRDCIMMAGVWLRDHINCTQGSRVN